MSDPLVSVVLPTYNRARVLDRAIDSVLGQEFADLELVVVDDGSTDDTPELVDSYDDSRLRYVRHDTNRGAGVARNRGIELARGEYVAFQDSDDEWLPGKLDAQVRAFSEASEDVGVVYTGFNRIVGDTSTYVPGPNVGRRSGDVRRELLSNNFITTAAAAVRRTALESVDGFDAALPRLQDWDLWLRLSESWRFHCIDEPLVNQYLQPDSVSFDDEALAAAKRRMLRVHADAFEELPSETLAVHHARLGKLLCQQGELAAGRRHLRRAVTEHPRPRHVANAALAHVPAMSPIF